MNTRCMTGRSYTPHILLGNARGPVLVARKQKTRGRRRLLNLHRLEAVLPDDDVGGCAVLTVVEEDDPVYSVSVYHPGSGETRKVVLGR